MYKKNIKKFISSAKQNKKRSIIICCISIVIILAIIISIFAYNKTKNNYALKRFGLDIIGMSIDDLKSIDNNNMMKNTNDDGNISYGYKYGEDIFKSDNEWENNAVSYTFENNKLSKYLFAYMCDDNSQDDESKSKDTNDHLAKVEDYFFDKYGDGECINNKYLWKTDYGYVTVYSPANDMIFISLTKGLE